MMSRFSGKCDLYDWLSILDEGRYTPYATVDERLEADLVAFEKFKKQVNGKIYVRVDINLNERNIENELELWKTYHPGADSYVRIEEEELSIKDKRCKNGVKTKKVKHYYWMEREFKNVSEIPFTPTREVKIDTIIDLIPYFPYIISVGSSEYIQLTSQSFVDLHYNECREWGFTQHREWYDEELKEYTIEIIKYMTKKGLI